MTRPARPPYHRAMLKRALGGTTRPLALVYSVLFIAAGCGGSVSTPAAGAAARSDDARGASGGPAAATASPAPTPLETFEAATAEERAVVAMARIRSCGSPSFSPDGKQIAFVSDLSGVRRSGPCRRQVAFRPR